MPGFPKRPPLLACANLQRRESFHNKPQRAVRKNSRPRNSTTAALIVVLIACRKKLVRVEPLWLVLPAWKLSE
jgi:hypothetical protein